MKKLFIGAAVAIILITALLAGIYFIFPGVVIKTGYMAERRSAGVEVKQVTVDGYKWVYLDGGNSQPVLMLHGFGIHKDFWGKLPAALTKNYRVIIPDLPGFGENTRIATDTYNLSNQARRVKEFADKIGLKNFNLIGFSMGGGIAAYFAGEYPDMVNKLVLISAVGINTPAVTEFESMVLKGETPLIYQSAEDYDKVLSLAFYAKPEIPQHFKNYIAKIGAENYSFHRKIFNELKNEPNILENRLQKIKAKTLIVWGDKDRIFDISTAYVMKNGIKDSTLFLIPNSGHMLYIEKPDESINAVTDFFAVK